MEINEVYDILKQLENYPYQEIDFEIDGLKLHVKKGEANLEQKNPTTSLSTKQTLIKSPMVGIVHLDDKIQPGTAVQKGEVIAQIESMKLFNDLKATQTGTVSQILIEDQAAVSYDQPLFEIVGD